MNPWSHAAVALLLGIAGCSSQQSAATRGPTAAEGPHQLRVEIKGLACCEATVRVGLFAQPSSWLKQAQVFKARLALVQSTQSSLVFYGLPPGRYAVAAFHDQNNNGRLDRWFGLIPKEPVAYSVVSGRRRPPSFGDSSLAVPQTQVATVAF